MWQCKKQELPETFISYDTILLHNSEISLRMSVSLRPALGNHCTDKAYGFLFRESKLTIKIKTCVTGTLLKCMTLLKSHNFCLISVSLHGMLHDFYISGVQALTHSVISLYVLQALKVVAI